MSKAATTAPSSQQSPRASRSGSPGYLHRFRRLTPLQTGDDLVNGGECTVGAVLPCDHVHVFYVPVRASDSTASNIESNEGDGVWWTTSNVAITIGVARIIPAVVKMNCGLCRPESSSTRLGHEMTQRRPHRDVRDPPGC